MFEFEKPNIEINEISEDNRFGRFVVEPLERGYGTTLGNSLRRIMLSSLPGAAVSSVKIKGVLHEFSSIPGVKEDVPEIIMNIKSLAIKNNSSSAETKQAYIEFSGKGVVTAGDIKADSDIEILNPELVIATLSDDSSKLDMELTITNGRGYVGADKADKEGKSMLISRTFSFSSSSFSTITSAVLAFSERSTNKFKCSHNTFAAKLTDSSGVSVPFVNTSNVNLS